MQPQPSPQNNQPALPPVPFDIPDSVVTPTAMQPQQPRMADNDDLPPIADDGDLIEKDWVFKVKQIISATANDPYQQTKQLTALKTDYLQKRYGKTIKAEY